MLIGLHDAEMEHFGKANKFPNYALMKISAYHKSIGDKVEWFFPMQRYDIVYSSKVFDFTPENPYLPPDTIKGGTGYGIFEDLPEEIDRMFPDYSIYPDCDYAIGYITRGCIRNCPWCIVPKKEGKIHPYRTWKELIRYDTPKLTLMDNNILSCDFGVEQLEDISKTDYLIDLNQGMDLRLVTPHIADILSKIKWQKYTRFSVDQKAKIEPFRRVNDMLVERGVSPSKLFCYFIVRDDEQDAVDRISAIREINNKATVYAQAEINPGIVPKRWQNVFARKYIYPGDWRKKDWFAWKDEHKFYFEKE